MTFAVGKVIAFVVFAGAIAGATYGVQTIVSDQLWHGLLTASPAQESVNGTAGNDVTFVVSLRNADAAPHEIRAQLTSDVFSQEKTVTVPGAGATALFFTGSLPADAAPGTHAVQVKLTDDDGRAIRQTQVGQLRVLPPPDDGGYALGTPAEIAYTAWLADTGTVFESNDPDLTGLSFARTDSFRRTPFPAQVPSRIIPGGVLQAIAGMQVGESRTITLEPGQAFGEATLETSMAREETLPLKTTYPNTERPEDRSGFDRRIRETGQGDPSTFRAGDTFIVTTPTGNDIRYVITAIDDRVVRSRLALEIGESVTLFNAWPNASAVTHIDDETVSFLTTPTTDVGEPITFYPHWPGMSAIASMNETQVVVRHTPTVGTTHEERTSGDATVTLTVKEVTDDEIVFSYPSNDPLAGKCVVFDVELVRIRS